MCLTRATMRDYVDSYDLDDAESEIDNIYNESEY